ncbi:hypothetical protein [Spirosoma panaciterrae]|uniref:hypothetical protein n=1 Tax=Spirosoma panaciterrae TaxID=496058 RepID=UPI00036E4E92|nr:hypothetical protein [Spirosoma panaciterrae]
MKTYVLQGVQFIAPLLPKMSISIYHTNEIASRSDNTWYCGLIILGFYISRHIAINQPNKHKFSDEFWAESDRWKTRVDYLLCLLVTHHYFFNGGVHLPNSSGCCCFVIGIMLIFLADHIQRFIDEMQQMKKE